MINPIRILSPLIASEARENTIGVWFESDWLRK